MYIVYIQQVVKVLKNIYVINYKSNYHPLVNSFLLGRIIDSFFFFGSLFVCPCTLYVHVCVFRVYPCDISVRIRQYQNTPFCFFSLSFRMIPREGDRFNSLAMASFDTPRHAFYDLSGFPQSRSRHIYIPHMFRHYKCKNIYYVIILQSVCLSLPYTTLPRLFVFFCHLFKRQYQSL